MLNFRNPEHKTETMPVQQIDALVLWRERLLNTVTMGGTISGSLAVISTVITDAQSQNWRRLITVLIIYSILLIVTFVRRLPFQLRAGVLVFLLTALMLNSLFSSGLRGDARLYEFVLIMITLAFFGARAGWVALGLNTLTMIIMAWAVVTKQVALSVPFDQLDAGAWMQNIAVSILLSVVSILILLILQQEFAAAQQHKQKELHRVIADSEQMEQRVSARTKDLAIAAEVGTATATILETDTLLQEVVNLTKERFKLYHSHIYLIDEANENLVLASGAGEAGRQMKAQGLSIPLDREQSLVARAARERKGIIVNDVTQEPDFLPNPLLPDTRSELAVPMIVGRKVIGVFDVQSDVIGRFTESDINIQTTLATQVSASIQNVRSFEQSRSLAELETLVNAIGQKIQRATTVENTLQIAIREIGLALGASRVSINVQANRQGDRNEANLN